MWFPPLRCGIGVYYYSHFQLFVSIVSYSAFPCSGLNMSTEEFQMSYNSSNNEMEQRSYRKTNGCASYTLSSGELSSSSEENQTKKRNEERK